MALRPLIEKGGFVSKSLGSSLALAVALGSSEGASRSGFYADLTEDLEKVGLVSNGVEAGHFGIVAGLLGIEATDVLRSPLLQLDHRAGAPSVLADGMIWTTSSGVYVRIDDTTELLVPASALGSMAYQDASSVAISGGSINGTAIGGTTASTGRFTYVDYVPAVAPAYVEGRVFYSSDDKTLCYYTDVPGTTLNIGEEHWVKGRNTTGVTIADGTVVYVSGATGANALVAPADADIAAQAESVIGLVTADILHNATGRVTTSGIVRGLNTLAWAEGTTLYLSQTPGVLTDVRPLPPAHAIRIGVVTYQHGTHGQVLVHVDRGNDLSNLHDTILTTPAANHFLAYDGSVWRNRDLFGTANTWTAPQTFGSSDIGGGYSLGGTFQNAALSGTQRHVVSFGGGTDVDKSMWIGFAWNTTPAERYGMLGIWGVQDQLRWYADGRVIVTGTADCTAPNTGTFQILGGADVRKTLRVGNGIDIEPDGGPTYFKAFNAFKPSMATGEKVYFGFGHSAVSGQASVIGYSHHASDQNLRYTYLNMWGNSTPTIAIYHDQHVTFENPVGGTLTGQYKASVNIEGSHTSWITGITFKRADETYGWSIHTNDLLIGDFQVCRQQEGWRKTLLYSPPAADSLQSTVRFIVTDTTDCTAINTGALQVAGGIYSGGQIRSYGSQISTFAAANGVAQLYAETIGTGNMTLGVNLSGSAYGGCPNGGVFVGSGLAIPLFILHNQTWLAKFEPTVTTFNSQDVGYDVQLWVSQANQYLRFVNPTSSYTIGSSAGIFQAGDYLAVNRGAVNLANFYSDRFTLSGALDVGRRASGLTWQRIDMPAIADGMPSMIRVTAGDGTYGYRSWDFGTMGSSTVGGWGFDGSFVIRDGTPGVEDVKFQILKTGQAYIHNNTAATLPTVSDYTAGDLTGSFRMYGGFSAMENCAISAALGIGGNLYVYGGTVLGDHDVSAFHRISIGSRNDADIHALEVRQQRFNKNCINLTTNQVMDAGAAFIVGYENAVERWRVDYGGRAYFSVGTANVEALRTGTIAANHAVGTRLFTAGDIRPGGTPAWRKNQEWNFGGTSSHAWSQRLSLYGTSLSVGGVNDPTDKNNARFVFRAATGSDDFATEQDILTLHGTGAVDIAADLNLLPTSASEGGQINLFPGTGYGNYWVIDHYTDDLRFFTSAGFVAGLFSGKTQGTGAFVVQYTTDCSAPNTGALQVAGGAYVAGTQRVGALSVGGANFPTTGTWADLVTVGYGNAAQDTILLGYLGNTTQQMTIGCNNRTFSAWKPLSINGSTVTLRTSETQIFQVGSAYAMVGTLASNAQTGDLLPMILGGHYYGPGKNAATRDKYKLRLYDDGTGFYGMTVSYDGTSGAIEYMSDGTNDTTNPRHRFHCGSSYLSAFVVAGDHVAVRTGSPVYLRKQNDYADTNGDVRWYSDANYKARLQARVDGAWVDMGYWEAVP